MIYPDWKLKEWGHAKVDLFNDLNVNPGSVDLTLGNKIATPMWYWRIPIVQQIAWLIDMLNIAPKNKKGDRLLPKWCKPYEFKSHWLMPGDFVLCSASEYTRIPLDAIGILFSKSSDGREGLEHLHAGYADQGFEGELTLEFMNVSPWPIKLVVGKRMMQLVLMEAGLPDKDYSLTGHYQGQTGPTEAR